MPQAWILLAIFSLHKHVTLSTIQAGPCGDTSNERLSGPSGLSVLAGLNASGLRLPPGPNMAALHRVKLRGVEDKSGWSGMVIKHSGVSAVWL